MGLLAIIKRKPDFTGQIVKWQMEGVAEMHKKWGARMGSPELRLVRVRR